MADPLSETLSKTTPGGPPEQIFLRSYTGDDGRPSDGRAGGRPAAPNGSRRSTDSIRVVHPEGAQTEAADAQILLLLGTQKE